jgi:hypothetical protein
MSEPHLVPQLDQRVPATPTITDDTLIKSATRNLRGPSS